MYEQESIYNLLPRRKINPKKKPLYKSHCLPTLPPTGSTFNLLGSSFPNVSNMGGEQFLPVGGHPLTGSSLTFGKPKGSYRSDPSNFNKKKLFYSRNTPILLVRSQSEVKKPPVPKLKDKPLMGLSSCKNYISLNIIEAKLTSKRIKINRDDNYLNKKEYGKVPKYLIKIKQSTEEDIKERKELKLKKEEENQKRYLINEDELKNLRKGLNVKLDQLRLKYGAISHKRVFDIKSHLLKKEKLEKEIELIENDLNKLNSSNNVIVDYTLQN